MTRANSIQLSQDLRIHNSRGCITRPTSVIRKRKSRIQLVDVNLSSHGLRQDAWTFHLLTSMRGPINPASSRCNSFACQSLLTPDGGSQIPFFKSAAVALTRSYNALRGSPLVLKMIPAVGVIAFAAWGLGPLM